MVRDFDGTELGEDRVAALCEDALFAPTAGNARGVELVVLAGGDGVRRYLAASTDEAWRSSAPRAAGLAAAGAVVVVVSDPSAYVARYGEADKASSGLSDLGAWPVPYWHGDAAFATMALLVLAESDGLAACFLGAFRARADVLALLGAADRYELFGAVLLGGAAAEQRPSPSLTRPGLTRAQRVHRGRLDG